MSNNQRILVVDDEKDVVTGFRRVFVRDNFDIEAAYSGQEALASIKRDRPDIVVMDLRMPGIDGLETLKRIKEVDPKILVVLMTAFSTSANVIEAMKYGAYDYLTKPFSVDKLREVVHGALKTAKDMNTVVNYQPIMDEEEYRQAIIGKSEAMQQVFKMVGQVATSNATVLITGESGTGKELIARAIFGFSERAEKPYIAVNCAAIPEALLESELFGHEKGAFTSATNRRLGKFELADGGTLFLDEIGDMSLTTQTKILRVLQSGEFERLGGSETLNVNVRIIAATNRNLEMMMEKGDFRPDLFYRLNVVRLQIPALSERSDDIPRLAEYFLRRYTEDRKEPINIAASAMEKMMEFSWPGNVRQLENVIRNAVLTAKGDSILPGDIYLKEEAELPRGADHQREASVKRINKPDSPPKPASVIPIQPAEGPQAVEPDPVFEDIDGLVSPIFQRLIDARSKGERFSAFDVMERSLLVHALNLTKGNQLRASKILGITRSTLRKRVQRYGLRIDTTVK